MSLNWNMETYATLAVNLASLAGAVFIIRVDWKRYGALFLLSGAVGSILCYMFIKFGFYSFPARIFPQVSVIPVETMFLLFPFLVLFGVRYSPASWAWKIPFYWVLVHLGVLSEALAEKFTGLIDYHFAWDLWDSYTWWWIFLLLFDLTGGLIVPAGSRRPVSPEVFRYGRWGFFVLHFILIITIFLGGFFLGSASRR